MHPDDLSTRVTIGTCASDDYCVTPGRRRKVTVYYPMGVPVLHVCKGCERRERIRKATTQDLHG